MQEIFIPITKIGKKNNFNTKNDKIDYAPIDLIIKPTVACNFKCTFCSSTYLSNDKQDKLDLKYLDRFFNKYPNTRTLIINGGDPLVLNPSYYFDILKLLEDKGMNTILSFTSNLWLFYLNPDKWADLFKHPQVNVMTSFQYGSEYKKGRIKHDLTPFTEDDFWKVSDKMLEYVGYRPSFIAVIDKSNEDSVVRTAKLAKEMQLVCKINYLLASGKETTFKDIKMGSENSMYTQADMYEKYIELYDNNVWMYEYNTIQFIDKLNNRDTTCPLARSCGSGIRALHPDGSYYSCGAYGDDHEYEMDFNQDMESIERIDPLNHFELLSMHDGCFSCKMYQICNGCKKTISDTKKLNLVKHHCSKMHEIMDRLLEIARLEKNHTYDKSYNKTQLDYYNRLNTYTTTP